MASTPKKIIVELTPKQAFLMRSIIGHYEGYYTNNLELVPNQAAVTRLKDVLLKARLKFEGKP